MVRVALFVAIAFAVGLAGAGAFNPDDGWLVRSYPAYMVFGITAYIGLAGIYLLLMAAVGRAVLCLARVALGACHAARG